MEKYYCNNPTKTLTLNKEYEITPVFRIWLNGRQRCVDRNQAAFYGKYIPKKAHICHVVNNRGLTIICKINRFSKVKKVSKNPENRNNQQGQDFKLVKTKTFKEGDCICHEDTIKTHPMFFVANHGDQLTCSGKNGYYYKVEEIKPSETTNRQPKLCKNCNEFINMSGGCNNCGH